MSQISPASPITRFAGRPLALGLFAALAVSPVAAQEAPAAPPRPSLSSTYVVPAGRGEAVRVTVYARRPAERGRLARRYKGLRANRTVRPSAAVARAMPAERVYQTPRARYVRRYGSYFQVLPRR